VDSSAFFIALSVATSFIISSIISGCFGGSGGRD
tara:strand:+ start:1100 stop:1201 length:102 start_codon:yes stop_codon:yes gene_type:complete